MSMKGIKMGANQSIEINTDKLLLTTSGKDPNIISYRKAINSNETPNNYTQNYGRLASAKVGGKPKGKLINSSHPRFNVNVDLDDRVVLYKPGGEASPNSIYKSTVLDQSLKDTCNLEQTDLRLHESAARNNSIINLKQLDMTPSRSFHINSSKFTQ